MTAGDLGNVMDNIGDALSGIDGLRVYDFPPKSAQPPFAFVDLPEVIEFDAGMVRGSDRMTINVIVCVADVVDRAARDAIAAYAAGSATGVKYTLETYGIGNSLRVARVQFRPVIMAGTTYLGAVFECDINY